MRTLAGPIRQPVRLAALSGIFDRIRPYNALSIQPGSPTMRSTKLAVAAGTIAVIATGLISMTSAQGGHFRDGFYPAIYHRPVFFPQPYFSPPPPPPVYFPRPIAYMPPPPPMAYGYEYGYSYSQGYRYRQRVRHTYRKKVSQQRPCTCKCCPASPASSSPAPAGS
jgi:hypothetical protein